MVPIYCGCVNTFYVKTGGKMLFFWWFSAFCCTCKPTLTNSCCFIFPPSLFMYSLCRTAISVLSGDREKSLVFLLCYTDPFSHNPKEMNEMLRKMKGEKKVQEKEDQAKMLDSHSLASTQESKPITKTVDFCKRNEWPFSQTNERLNTA